MARKHKHEEHENHERWLVSYADFITLLFAFFVVMYSISSVNEGKYRILSESMSAAFRSSERALKPIQVGMLVRSPRNPFEQVMDTPRPIGHFPIMIDAPFAVERPQMPQVNPDRWQMDAAEQQVDDIASEVEQAMASLIERALVTVRRNPLWLEVELNTSFLFESGSARPSIDAEVILLQLGKVLKEHPNRIHVEGFTDNVPIRSDAFPSNWELSSARAAAVVRLFVDYGLAPERLASIGYGEFRPVASNDTETGRERNRRVVLVILAHFDGDGEASVTDFELLRQKLESTPAIVD